MPENASGAAKNEGDREFATPRRELARLRESKPQRGQEARERLQEAMLLAGGELGYRNVAIRDVLERAGASRVLFYRQFESKEDCYARSYAAAVDELCESLLAAGASEPTWRSGLRAALGELARFAAARPVLARGILAEVHVAGGPAMAKREEVFERLTRAIDSARRETISSRHSPPPITAAFMVSAIEEAVVMSLVKGDPGRFAAAVPELVYLVSSAYFGDGIARAELAAARG